MPTLVVNGESRSFDGDPSMPLLWYLRDDGRIDGHEIRLRRRSLRRLHDPPRRRGRALLHDHGRHGRRQDGHDHRGSESRRRARRAEGVARSERAAVRLLPGRPDHAGRVASGQEPVRPRTRRSSRRCPAISAAAAAISAFTRPFASQREEFDHVALSEDDVKRARKVAEPATIEPRHIENVSRRQFLGGVCWHRASCSPCASRRRAHASR